MGAQTLPSPTIQSFSTTPGQSPGERVGGEGGGQEGGRRGRCCVDMVRTGVSQRWKAVYKLLSRFQTVAGNFQQELLAVQFCTRLKQQSSGI